MLAFNPSDYGLVRGTSALIDQYDPGFTNNTISVSYHASPTYGGVNTPYGYLYISLSVVLNLRPGRGRAYSAGRNNWGGGNYVIPLANETELREVVATLQPGSQLRGAGHLSMLVSEGMIPSGLSATGRADLYRTQGLISAGGVDISEVRQQQMISDFIFGRITSRQLADFYSVMIREGAQMSDQWYGGALSGRGMLFTRTAGLISDTPTISFPGGPTVSAPSGGNTVLPPRTGGGTPVLNPTPEDYLIGPSTMPVEDLEFIRTGQGGSSAPVSLLGPSKQSFPFLLLVGAAIVFFIMAES